MRPIDPNDEFRPGRARVRTQEGATDGRHWRDARFWILLGFMLSCLLGGGAARADVLSLMYLRPAAVLAGAAMLLLSERPGVADARAPLWLLGALAASMLLQLIPLPPDLWLSLPGRARYAEAATAAGMAQPWRPLSLTPELTLNSLVSLLTPAVTLLGFALLHARGRAWLLPVVLVGAVATAAVGVLQLSGASGLYLYRVTNWGFPVGVMANRNHQAAFLAAALPLLRAWAEVGPGGGRSFRMIAALGTGASFLVVILVTGSRAGLLLALAGVFAALFLAPLPTGGVGKGRTPARLVTAGVGAGAAALIGLAWFSGRATVLDRFGSEGAGADVRFTNLPTVWRIVGEFMPFGTGFGSFDPVFRGFEADTALRLTYFNHAHNDLVELAMTGGVPALLVLFAFLLWFSKRTLRVFRPMRGRQRPSQVLGRAGAVAVGLLLAASLVDYPLRTPLLMMLFACCCGWLSDARTEEREG